MNAEALKKIVKQHQLWLIDQQGGQYADLRGASLREADFCEADLREADFCEADLRGAYLRGADLRGASLREADFCEADLCGADLCGADLRGSSLRGADLRGASLREADLREADFCGASLRRADLRRADLRGADFCGARHLVKLMGVEPGNCYWKRFDAGLTNRGYRYFVGLNELPPGKTFAADERVLCSYPGFHFASRSWCAVRYPHRPFEARIRIPLDAQVNEPWATDGEASADKIEILQVFDTATGEDVTDNFRRPENAPNVSGQLQDHD